MSIEASTMTVWRYLREDGDGCAVYSPRVGTAYVTYAEKGDSRHGYSHAHGSAEETVTGFLLPARAEGADGMTDLPFFLVPDRDLVAPGNHAAEVSPTEAAKHGAAVFSVTSSVQPPHISDGTLVNWCCFEGVRITP